MVVVAKQGRSVWLCGHMKLIYIFLKCHILRDFRRRAILDESLAPVGVKAGGNTEKWKSVWTLDEPDISQVDISVWNPKNLTAGFKVKSKNKILKSHIW